MALSRMAALLMVSAQLIGCGAPQPGPDKTVGGAILGAGWGAGTGAVIGHQISYAGEGAAVGAGFGLVSGAITGYGYDTAERNQIENREALASLRLQNSANARQLAKLQSDYDKAIATALEGGIYQVYFDPDQTNLRLGAVANLEAVTESLKSSPRALKISISGHSDDAGKPEYNERLAEARARTVAAYMASRGISMDQIKVASYGSSRPIASNATETGRQMNRRVDIHIER